MKNLQTKKQRDQQILHLLTKFKICSRNQLAHMIFKNNSHPINVTNRVMKRLSMDGTVLQVKREKDKCYLYTCNPSPIHHKSNMIQHHLKIVDFYIEAGCPVKCIIEPVFGSYQPDLFFKDKRDNSICVEIQLTPISHKKMQTKINQFVSEHGKEHDAKILVLCSDYNYKKLAIPNHFKLIKKSLPKEFQF